MSARPGVEHGTNTVSADSRRGPPTFKWHCKALWWRASTIWYVNVLRSFVSCHLPHLTARNPKGHREAWFMYFIPVGGISKWQHGFKWDGGGGMRVPIIHLYFHRFPFLEMHYNGMGISRGMLRNQFWKLSLSYLPRPAIVWRQQSFGKFQRTFWCVLFFRCSGPLFEIQCNLWDFRLKPWKWVKKKEASAFLKPKKLYWCDS